jgi:hypothetical protein
VRSTQSTPFNTSRGSRQGRPPLEPVLLRSDPGKEARMASHCSSVRSITTVDHECDLPSIPCPNPIEFRGLTLARVVRCVLVATFACLYDPCDGSDALLISAG